jgi:hypothetical protein
VNAARRLENILLSILVAIASFMANYLKEMSTSVANLNEKMAAIIERTTRNTETLSQHETRIRVLERRSN